jgi:hypothetical protein
VKAKSADMQFTASADGVVACKTATGQVCSNTQMQAAVTKAGYNVKENVK